MRPTLYLYCRLARTPPDDYSLCVRRWCFLVHTVFVDTGRLLACKRPLLVSVHNISHLTYGITSSLASLEFSVRPWPLHEAKGPHIVHGDACHSYLHTSNLSDLLLPFIYHA